MASEEREWRGTVKTHPCPEHPTEPLRIFCSDCQKTVCDVCFPLYHDRHAHRYLSDVAADSRRTLKPMMRETTSVTQRLNFLLNDVQPSEEQLHKYVDEEIAQLEAALQAKRNDLHADATNRANQMRAMIQAEMDLCRQELKTIEDGQAVLKALSQGEGLVDCELGDLILGHMTYNQFKEAIHKPLHEPKKMLTLQGLQLPVQDLQLVCDLVDWTPASVNTAPQVFPSDRKLNV